MIEDGQSFRIQVRLSKAEFPDLYEELKRYPEGKLQTGRIRYFLRLGLIAARGERQESDIGMEPDEAASFLPPVQGSAERLPTSPMTEADALTSLGLDISNFSFNTSALITKDS